MICRNSISRRPGKNFGLRILCRNRNMAGRPPAAPPIRENVRSVFSRIRQEPRSALNLSSPNRTNVIIFAAARYAAMYVSAGVFRISFNFCIKPPVLMAAAHINRRGSWIRSCRQKQTMSQDTYGLEIYKQTICTHKIILCIEYISVQPNRVSGWCRTEPVPCRKLYGFCYSGK